MGLLLLVRHGQASFLDGDYDRLSPLGERQAERLGAHWAERGVRLSSVAYGPRRRHRQTAEAIGRAMRDAGGAWPEPVLLPELDEYRADALLNAELGWVAERADLLPLLNAFQAAPDRPRRARAFEHLFQAVMRLWVHGEIPASRIEPWVDFKARVAAALSTLTASGAPGRTIAAVSSAGTIGAMIAAVVGAGASAALELGCMINNASVSEILFGNERVSLSRFNSAGHLDDPELSTYR